jgi:hypothetical protein
MSNPFEKRATEYLRDDEAFLSVVTPEPLDAFYTKYAEAEALYDRLVFIVGTPGSGKTTISRLFQYTTLDTIIKKLDFESIKDTASSLARCKAIEGRQVKILGCRLPLEGDYRIFWELPYPEEIRHGLMISLLQARAVLGWLRSVEETLGSLEGVTIIPKADAQASLAQIGGKKAHDVLERAKKIEQAIYDIVADLIPPTIEEISSEATSPYQPLDVIEYIRLPQNTSSPGLRPLAIFDDAHTLHEKQFRALKTWLMRREMKVARWIQTRLDPLTSKEIFCNEGVGMDSNIPGIKASREITYIKLQKLDDRKASREVFRKMAKSMANRYLGRMEIFQRLGHNNFASLLAVPPPQTISPSKLKELAAHVDKLQAKYNISETKRTEIETLIKKEVEQNQPDLFLSILSILFERYAKRIPQQLSLLSPIEDPILNRPLTVDASVISGAEIHLLHNYERPYYFGMEILADASSENAEQFLQLASRLVAHAETQLIRRKSPSIDSKTQHKLLTEKAAEIIKDWHFPHHQLVHKLTSAMANQCIQRTLEGNAPLGSGASAVGILQEDFDTIDERFFDLAEAIKFGIAYNAINYVPDYGTKNKKWCLLELNGILLLHYRLTLKRGGFIERTSADLNNMLKEK